MGVSNTVFVLGAGFSVEQGYPLARDMRKEVICFLSRERHSRYWGWMQPWDGGYEKGQFYTGFEMIEGNKEFPFEELLLELAVRLKQEDAGPCHQTNEVLRIGVRRLLWKIHKSYKEVKPAYGNFAAWLRADWQRHGIISFNWDLQAERLLHQAGVPWHYDRECQGRLPVIKPHGSINWNKYLQKDYSAHYSFWRCVSRDSKLSFDAKNPLSNPDPDDVVDLSYMLFPGDPDRPESHDDMKLLWRDAAHLMDRADEVVFIGYSFPEYDSYSRQFFRNRVRNKNIVVVNPTPADLVKYESILGTEIEFCREEFQHCLYAQSITGA